MHGASRPRYPRGTHPGQPVRPRWPAPRPTRRTRELGLHRARPPLGGPPLGLRRPKHRSRRLPRLAHRHSSRRPPMSLAAKVPLEYQPCVRSCLSSSSWGDQAADPPPGAYRRLPRFAILRRCKARAAHLAERMREVAARSPGYVPFVGDLHSLEVAMSKPIDMRGRWTSPACNRSARARSCSGRPRRTMRCSRAASRDTASRDKETGYEYRWKGAPRER